MTHKEVFLFRTSIIIKGSQRQQNPAVKVAAERWFALICSHVYYVRAHAREYSSINYTQVFFVPVHDPF